MEPSDPRIYLAEERTFLAWIRTGLALMGFGFIVARFGLFLREELAYGRLLPERAGVSLPLGICLILLGILVNSCAALRHHRHIRALDRGEFRSAFSSSFAFFIAGVLVIIGLGIAIYLSRF
ncbi:YidH family protein [Pelotalea chapellei]|uniref:DUF202 domain-containing protein n=1 Tax=Pelotalea chapellei TaxID=44671 RepID=A0ABS5U3V1_9BACT|nr:DUF202 domain-containing protein [Pelotalea chapellei]MBT1070348.1 DUF202 domain-containing protein [Pelotalea chapellei]